VHDTFDGVIAGNRINAAGSGNRISRVTTRSADLQGAG
jgi:hypothetical protein